MEETQPTRNMEEQEIDLIEIVRKLWRKRKFIIKVTFVFMVLGVLVALLSPKVYTAQCMIVPQTGAKSPGGNLSGLAAMAGINLGSMESSGELLSPKIYPKILSSVPFQKDLMQISIKFKDYDEPIRILDYYTDKKYQKFSLIGCIKKYTIGLPGVILNVLKGKPVKEENIVGEGVPIEILTKEESDCAKILSSIYFLSLNDKEGYFTLSANMPEPFVAAQFVAAVQGLLQKYVTAFKIEKVKNNLDFIESRYQDAKQNFEMKQQELATYRDANQNLSLRKASIMEERLKTECDLLFGVYSELAKQREQANIQVKEMTPIFTIVDPVTVPTERSKPKRGLICIAFTFLGMFAGIGLVLVLPFIAKTSGSRCLTSWLPEKN